MANQHSPAKFSTGAVVALRKKLGGMKQEDFGRQYGEAKSRGSSSRWELNPNEYPETAKDKILALINQHGIPVFEPPLSGTGDSPHRADSAAPASTPAATSAPTAQAAPAPSVGPKREHIERLQAATEKLPETVNTFSELRVHLYAALSEERKGQIAPTLLRNEVRNADDALWAKITESLPVELRDEIVQNSVQKGGVVDAEYGLNTVPMATATFQMADQTNTMSPGSGNSLIKVGVTGAINVMDALLRAEAARIATEAQKQIDEATKEASAPPVEDKAPVA